MPLFDFKCPKCNNWRNDVLTRNGEVFVCELCDTPMEKLPPLVAPAVFARPSSATGAREWAKKEQVRLQQRSDDYDRSPKGKQERDEQVHKLREKGTIPEGWSA